MTSFPTPRCPQLSWASHPGATSLPLPVRAPEGTRLGVLPRFHRRPTEVVRLLPRGESCVSVLPGPTRATRPRRVLVPADTLRVPLRRAEARRPFRVACADSCFCHPLALQQALSGLRRRHQAGQWVEGASPPGCPVAVPPWVKPSRAACVSTRLADHAVVYHRAEARSVTDLCHRGRLPLWPTSRRPATSLESHRPTEVVRRPSPARPSTRLPHDPDETRVHLERAPHFPSARPRRPPASIRTPS